MGTSKTYVGVRLDSEQLARLDALCRGQQSGLVVSRSEVIRAVIERGLVVLERETARRAAKPVGKKTRGG